MKRFSLLTSLLFFVIAASAQSIENAAKHIYYERYNSAETELKAVVQNDPDEEKAWYLLTKAIIMQDEAGRAKASLQLAPADLHDEPYYQVARGYVALAENDHATASSMFEAALKETKRKDADILEAVAQAHITTKTGDANYAIQLLYRAIEREEEKPSLYVTLGNAYRKLHNGSEAYKAYKKALDYDGGYAKALHQIGDIFLSQKNADMYLEYFKRAVSADAAYAPSLYKLYLYYFYYDVPKAMDYYQQYMANADKGLQNQYDMADLHYLNKDYKKAIEKAKSIMQEQNEKTKPRLYKLVGYSYAALNDSATATQYMHHYFSNESDSNLIAKDYELMAQLQLSQNHLDSAVMAYSSAITLLQDSMEIYKTYKQLADLYKNEKDFANEALWLGKYYTGNLRVTNVDLFNWALAHYRAEEYNKADTVFGLYVSKYPEQSFGYYWRARSNAALDKDLSQGLAVPHYKKLIDVLNQDSTNANQNWLIEAYNYLAAYETNTEKDYEEAIGYFEKVLAIDPENEDARRYKAMLEKNVANSGSR